MKNQSFETKKSKNLSNSKSRKEKSLPWWVELLFVQIGLPDKLLVKILKAKKDFKVLITNDKKTIFIFLLAFSILAYFYPVVKQAKNKLDCENIAKNYFTINKKQINLNKKDLKMLSTNFCNGGKEIYENGNFK